MAEPPPNLAPLQLPQWVRQHHPRTYDRDILDPPSEREEDIMMLKNMGKIAGYMVRGGIGPLGWLSLGGLFIDSLERRELHKNLPRLRKEAQREDFRNLMWEKFWTNDAMYDSRAVREAAFDEAVGDNVSHGIAPALSEQAEVRRSELMDRIDDRWLDKLERGTDLVATLEFYEENKPGPNANEAERQAWADSADWARKELDAFTAGIAAEAVQDIQLVKDFESEPSNWNLTPDQHILLTSRVAPPESVPPSDGDQSCAASDDDQFYDVVGGRPD